MWTRKVLRGYILLLVNYECLYKTDIIIYDEAHGSQKPESPAKPHGLAGILLYEAGIPGIMKTVKNYRKAVTILQYFCAEI